MGYRNYYDPKVYADMMNNPKHNTKKIIKNIVLAIVIVYFAVILGGTFKVQPIYENVQKYTVIAGTPVQFIEKNFFDHFKSMVTQFSLSWHYIVSDEEVIYTELMIEYGKAAGLKTRELEEYLAIYESLN